MQIWLRPQVRSPLQTQINYVEVKSEHPRDTSMMQCMTVAALFQPTAQLVWHICSYLTDSARLQDP